MIPAHIKLQVETSREQLVRAFDYETDCGAARRPGQKFIQFELWRFRALKVFPTDSPVYFSEVSRQAYNRQFSSVCL